MHERNFQKWSSFFNLPKKEGEEMKRDFALISEYCA
nr:MAG TPA: pre-rRNA processing protein [Caudoviricetes sp.]